MENVENLKALISGHKLNIYQRDLALNEFKYLLSEVTKLESRIKELEEEKTTELITELEDYYGLKTNILKTKCCGIAPITTENYCPNCGHKKKK